MNRIKEAQDIFLNEILDFFKRNPDKNFTSGYITKKFDLEVGYQGYFIYNTLYVLVQRNELEKLEHGKGFKYKEKDQKCDSCGQVIKPAA